MIIILEKFSLKALFFIIKKTLINKLKKKKIIKIYIIENKNKNILSNILIKILIKNLKEFKWNLIDINDHNNSCIINSLRMRNSIYPNLLTKATGFKNLSNKDNFFYFSLKYRLLELYHWPSSNNYILSYLIIVFAIKKNFPLNEKNEIYLLLENFLFSKFLSEFAKKYNIQIEFIKKKYFNIQFT